MTDLPKWPKTGKIIRMSKMCGRCYDEVLETFPAQCEEKPEELLGKPIGMYHCPDCWTMVLAGFQHPEFCKRCLDFLRHSSSWISHG